MLKYHHQLNICTLTVLLMISSEGPIKSPFRTLLFARQIILTQMIIPQLLIRTQTYIYQLITMTHILSSNGGLYLTLRFNTVLIPNVESYVYTLLPLSCHTNTRTNTTTIICLPLYTILRRAKV